MKAAEGGELPLRSIPQHNEDDSIWFYMAVFAGILLLAAGYMQHREQEMARKYQKAKFEAKLKIAAAKDAFNLNKKEDGEGALGGETSSKKKKQIVMSDDDIISSSDDEISSSSDKSATVSANTSRLGGKDELAKAEGVMRSNSSYIDLTQTLTKRMKDDTLDHSKVLSESKHPITRICLTGGPCAGKTTALATLSTVL